MCLTSIIFQLTVLLQPYVEQAARDKESGGRKNGLQCLSTSFILQIQLTSIFQNKKAGSGGDDEEDEWYNNNSASPFVYVPRSESLPLFFFLPNFLSVVHVRLYNIYYITLHVALFFL